MTGLVLPWIDRSEGWVLGLWCGLFVVQAGQMAYARRVQSQSVTGVFLEKARPHARFKDGSVAPCTLACPVMLPIGFLLHVKIASGKHYAVPVLKANVDPGAYRRAWVWLRFYPK